MAGITLADKKYSGLSDLAEAQALIGDFEGNPRFRPDRSEKAHPGCNMT